jgi:NADH:ubiquinone oxidoreductase subunit 5 (subunit L)/multisubunit Na+/H+ antiporter MnhA subunit
MILHELSINAIRGFGKHKNVLKALFLVGLFAIIGMPGFNGFISKTLLHEALAEAHHMYHNRWLSIAEVIFTISSSFTVAYLLKIFVTVFMEKNEKYKGQYRDHLKKRAIVPMILLSTIIIYIGIKPRVILNILEGTMEIFDSHGHIEPHFYSADNIKSSMITIVYGSIIYFGFIRNYLRKVKNGEPVYVNPSLSWFNLEKHVYIPVGIFLYRSSSIIFKVIDRGVINLVIYISDAIKALSGIKVVAPHKAFKNFKIKKPRILKGEGYKKEFATFSDVLSVLRFNLNSLMYSVFILAMMIIIVLGVLVF